MIETLYWEKSQNGRIKKYDTEFEIFRSRLKVKS